MFASLLLPPTAPPHVSPMHIPDGFLSVPVATVCYAIAVVAIAIAVQRTNRRFDDKAVPLMGVLAAFIFAAQMMNFPVAGGTSGHFLGAALAVILLGPWAGMIVMTSVVGVQAVVFQDGGLSALGANLLNMAVVGAAVSYPVYRITTYLSGDRRPALMAGVFAAAWLSPVVASIFAASELAISGTSPLNIALPAMLGVHALIGLGEGLITVAAVSFVLATRPDLVESPAQTRKEASVAHA